MARPKADPDKTRAVILDEAERMLEETMGRRLFMSDIAARMGISQSYVHRFYRTKADLVKCLAQRWFHDVQAEADRIADLDLPAEDRLDMWVLSLLHLKRERFDANPELFRAYVDLAAQHMPLLGDHAEALEMSLRRILRDMVEDEHLDEAVVCVQDATILFTMPFNIARFPQRATPARAKVVLRVLRAGLDALSKNTKT